ncbi:hypothetical protein FJO69_01045 [[Mycoplasma] falconis]|uniref:Uncharacterized protein n=1 Tax=[Mycoplasma] falconis TaxID=92403 RepID=A0A501XB25_9BACT|nr:hypothetical protein [[Mycoplasma] falconis]TPE57770.1 hypothetical protein FJO69_01045 [[Mycoplasma] falconis]
MNNASSEATQNTQAMPTGYIALWIVLTIIAMIAITTLIIFAYYRRLNKIKNSSGFFVFVIEKDKMRIKIEGHNRVEDNSSWFFKKTNLPQGQWIKLDSFLSLFNEDFKKQMLDVLANKKTGVLKTDLDNKNYIHFSTNVKIEINNYEDNLIRGQFAWKDIDKRLINVFEEIDWDDNYLLKENNKYKSLVVDIKTEYYYDYQNIIDKLRYFGTENEIYGIKVLLKWNKMFFVVEEKKKKSNATEIIYKLAAYIKNFYWFYNNIYTINDETIKLIPQNNLELLLDWLKAQSDKNTKDLIEINSNIFQDEDFVKFAVIYQKINNKINEELKLVNKQQIIKNLTNQKTVIKQISYPHYFKHLNLKNNKNLNNMFIYHNLYNKIYQTIACQETDSTVLKIDDFVFNSIDFKLIAKIAKKSPTFISLVKFSGFKSLNTIKNNITNAKLDKKINIAINIDKLNNDIIESIDEKIKMIWLDKQITSNLNNPETILYINALLEKANEDNIKVVFEQLDYKNYSKILLKYKNIIYYTQ